MPANPRLTRVQAEAVELLKQDWIIMNHWPGYFLEKFGEPSRHMRPATFESLRDRGIVVSNGCCGWHLAPGATPRDGEHSAEDDIRAPARARDGEAR